MGPGLGLTRGTAPLGSRLASSAAYAAAAAAKVDHKFGSYIWVKIIKDKDLGHNP